MDDDEDGIVTASITITRRLFPGRENPDPADTITVDVEGEPNLVDALGMIEMGRLHLIAPAILAGDDDD